MTTATATIAIESLYEAGKDLGGMTTDRLFAMEAKVAREVRRANAMQSDRLRKLLDAVRAEIRRRTTKS